ncbi:MAG: hypothetical protein J0L82_08990 [Deltaproteobacteria bacterium]|nr:hypothetical protein [Deltaproteobacteria bacterium]
MLAKRLRKLNGLSRNQKQFQCGTSVLMALLVFLFSFDAQSSNSRRYRVGGSVGFGGSGVTQVATVNEQLTIVERSEGPAVISFFADRLMSDYFSLGLEHTRGVNFAPFSMGSSFTGLTGRYYFWGPAASVAESEGTEALLLIRRFTPYAGVGIGAAMASIRRDNDLVPNIEGSGLYFGLRLGADYPLAPGIGIRPEFLYSTTIFQSPTLASSLSEYSLGCGLFMNF